MTRLPLLNKEDVAEENWDVYGAGFDLHRVTLHSPKLARLSRQIGLYFRNVSQLNPRLRELAILQVAYLCGSSYEYAHHLKIARELGASDDELSALGDDLIEPARSEESLTSYVLRAASELAAGTELSEATFAGLKGLPEDQLVDLLFLISFYCGFVRFTGALKLRPEPEYDELLRLFPLRTLNSNSEERKSMDQTTLIHGVLGTAFL